MTSSSSIVYIIAAVVVIAIVVAIIVGSQRARSARLQRRFGPEYDRTVKTTGDRAAAERELATREQRVRKFHIEELPAGARDRYAEEWRTVQSRFVDEPKGALTEADRLITSVMRDRGYPMDEFNTRVGDISVDHPRVVEDYRAAHDITARSERGEVTTEDLRVAMVHYRALFDDLLGSSRKESS